MERKPYIGMEIHSIDNMTIRYMENNSHKKLVDSIPGTNAWILGVLANNEGREVFQRDLEETFGITRSTVSKVINLMVQKGLIERSPVEYDARLKKLSLTDKSRELLGYMQEDNDNMDAVLTEGFSEEEKALLFSYLQRIKNNLKNKFEASGENLSGCFHIGEEE